MTTCTAGVFGDTCTPGSPTGADEDCNGVDEDCDGTADNHYVAAPTTCGVGACVSTGVTTCSGGTEGDTCVAGTGAADDATCDGVEDDCDGDIDEDYVEAITTCGVGVCEATGLMACVGGAVNDTCVAGEPTVGGEQCNGLDDDCDGRIDITAGGVAMCLTSSPTGGIALTGPMGGLICAQHALNDSQVTTGYTPIDEPTHFCHQFNGTVASTQDSVECAY